MGTQPYLVCRPLSGTLSTVCYPIYYLVSHLPSGILSTICWYPINVCYPINVWYSIPAWYIIPVWYPSMSGTPSQLGVPPWAGPLAPSIWPLLLSNPTSGPSIWHHSHPIWPHPQSSTSHNLLIWPCFHLPAIWPSLPYPQIWNLLHSGQTTQPSPQLGCLLLCSFQSHLKWVQSHLTCSPPHRNNIFQHAWNQSQNNHEATAFHQQCTSMSHQICPKLQILP